LALQKQHRLNASEFRYHVVDVAGVRLYVVGFLAAKTMGAIF
jgi:hypothetical protein